MFVKDRNGIIVNKIPSCNGHQMFKTKYNASSLVGSLQLFPPPAVVSYSAVIVIPISSLQRMSKRMIEKRENILDIRMSLF